MKPRPVVRGTRRGESGRAMHHPAALVRGSALALACAIALGVAPGRAAEAPDTTHCGPRIFVREAATRRALSGVRVHVTPAAAADRARTGAERRESTGDDGWLEFAALPVGSYVVKVSGVLARRDVQEAPSSVRPAAAASAARDGPPLRPQEVQLIRLRLDWRVTRGNCTDSLVVQVPPTRWRKVSYGERVLSLR